MFNRIDLGCPPEPRAEDVQTAAFIVGSLCHEGLLSLNLKSSDSRQDYINSIQLCAVILTTTRKDCGDQPELPFVW